MASLFRLLVFCMLCLAPSGSDGQEDSAPLSSSKNLIFTSISPKLVRAHSVYNLFITVEPLGTAPSNGGGPRDTITFIAELAGVPDPPPEANPPWEPVVPMAAEVGKQPQTKMTTTTTPRPPPVVQNYTSDYVTVEAGSSGSIALPVGVLTCSQYNLTVTALTNTEHRYCEQGAVFRDTRLRSVLIQTDRPIYKPGDTVKLRVIVLDRNLVPPGGPNATKSEKGIKDNLTVLIKDSRGNVIRDIRNAHTRGGLWSGSVELSSEPNLGDWRVTVTVVTPSKKGLRAEAEGGEDPEAEDGEEVDQSDGDGEGVPEETDGSIRTVATHSFTVEQYVLPKFKVELRTHPKFVTYNNSKLQLQVDASYTYGKKLEGFAIVTLKEPYGYTTYTYNPDGSVASEQGPRTVVKKTPIKGQAFVEFDVVRELLEPPDAVSTTLSPYPHPVERYQRSFQFDVSVVDTLTGRMVNGTHSATIYEHAYKMELIAPPASYKPGFPLTLHIKVSTQDDRPVHDPAPDALLLRHGYKCGAEDGVAKFHVPATGLVTFTVVTPTNEMLGSPGLEVVYKGQTVTLYPPQKATSPSHSYMQVEVIDAPLASSSSESTESDRSGSSQPPGAQGPKFPPGATPKVRVRVNKACSGGRGVDYVLYGRGELLAQGRSDTPAIASGHAPLPKEGNASAAGLHEHLFTLPALPPHAAPESTLVVYCVLEGSNEVLADSIKIRSETQFENHLNLKFSQQDGAPAAVNVTMEPGDNATLQLESMPRALVALRGVDQSVLVLKQDNDITQQKVDGEINKFQSQWSQFRVWGGAPAFQIFEEAGLVVLTNGVLERERWQQPTWRRHWRRGRSGLLAANGGFGGGGRHGFMAMGKAAPMMMAEDAGMAAPEMRMASSVAPGGDGAAASVRLRTHFPESWLWEEVQLNDSSSGLLNTVVPDTITSWYITGYSLHPEAGLALSGSTPAVVQVFRPFFVTLNVPYSVVKGETLALQVLVHNYAGDGGSGSESSGATEATVTLSNVDNSLSFNEHVNMYQESVTKVVRVASGSVASVLFVVTPIKHGTISLKVKGTTMVAGDAVEQPLIVKPPGHKMTRTTALLIDLKKEPSFDGTLTAAFPRGREPGADTLRVSVVGDLLGSTMKHLDRLLALPMGCGEQNMLNFVPDIVVLDYLNGTGGMEAESPVRGQAVKFLEQGYQRELTYRHYDGSFSAFGQSDPQGSTWLTAFVVRSFVQASGYITVDQNTIVQGLQYLVSHQHKDGSFIELGHVLHSEMQGGGGTGAGNALALTSFVLLSFIEARNSSALSRSRHEINFDEVIRKGVAYLLESYPVAKNDSYTVALVTHVLTTLRDGEGEAPEGVSEQADEFFKDLEQLGIKDGDMLHWDSAPKPYPLPPPDIGPEGFHGPFWPTYYHPTTRPVAVEITSYALMTYLARGDLMTSLNIARWLLEQRNAMGGFVSTQDTVVGLTALAKFASATRTKDTDMKVTFKREQHETEEHATVDGNNEIVLQEFQLLEANGSSSSSSGNSGGGELNDTVAVRAEGKGTALAVMTWTYYMEEVDKSPAFEVDVKVEPTVNNSGISLYICSRFLAGNRSNMIVQEVNLPSGYMFAQEDVKPLAGSMPRLKRVDLENVGTQLQMYFDFYLNNGTDCLTLRADRVFKVANPSKAYVHVYDYYDTTLSTVTYYEPPEVGPCELCENEVDVGGDGPGCKIQNC